MCTQTTGGTLRQEHFTMASDAFDFSHTKNIYCKFPFSAKYKERFSFNDNIKTEMKLGHAT